ncbi:arylsulfatase [Cyclobacterium jeungdonense]|uniref:Arylsulfatase n=1 Tax=Cyclobacterium jeungdonense TaxID=708087 RepID=A0ABT8CD70_9BACT|nr:arylsulfatase [Cyclobacterium jeungdonense]MDN3690714.1 arylsulfatase [Cyclobacterium jeungdonense]
MILLRRHLSIFLLGILFMLGCETQSQQRSPNVVLILTDDQGWGDLSHSGNPNLFTPNIDALAIQGVSFDRFFVSPVCSPTRAEMLTGRYHLRGGVKGTSAGEERLDLDETTFAALFQQAGYSTGAFGKWHSGMQHPYHPNSRGFDTFYGFCSGHWGNYFSPDLEQNGHLVKGEGYLPDDLTEKAMDFIEVQKDGPFLVYLPFNTPHSPMQVPDIWWEKFENKTLDSLVSGEDPDFTRAALAMCENIDWNVGRLMGKLEELGLTENTIVVFLSDNGPNSFRWNGGMKGRKGSTDEGGVRSPFFLQWEGRVPAGKTVPEIAGAIDLFPTLLDMAGLDYAGKKPLDGISLKPLILEENPSWKDRMIFSHWNGSTSLRTQKYRLDKDGNLYDMDSDPSQQDPVQDQHPEIIQDLRLAVTNWEAEMEAALAKDPESRPFTLGAPEAPLTQLPARDGLAHGKVKRSNRFPNDSFFTNWVSLKDSITWDVEVLEGGEYLVELYYTCPEEDLGAEIRLQVGENHVDARVKKAHNPPLKGMENDRIERMESYVKDFKSMPVGSIVLAKGLQRISLKALNIPGDQVMEVQKLLFTNKELNH